VDADLVLDTGYHPFGVGEIYILKAVGAFQWTRREQFPMWRRARVRSVQLVRKYVTSRLAHLDQHRSTGDALNGAWAKGRGLGKQAKMALVVIIVNSE